MTSPSALHLSLLRIPVLTILRANGFTATKPSILDTLADLTSRYLLLITIRAASYARSHSALDIPNLDQEEGFDPDPSSGWEQGGLTVTDVRLALQDVGLLHPFIGELEEQFTEEGEDTSGVNNFLAWARGRGNAEIRKCAGLRYSHQDIMTTIDTDATGLRTQMEEDKAKEADAEALALLANNGAGKTDFLTELMQKHSKTAEGVEARYQGTILGSDNPPRPVHIMGGSEFLKHSDIASKKQEPHKTHVDGANDDLETLDEISKWEAMIKTKMYGTRQTSEEQQSHFHRDDGASNDDSGSSLTDISDVAETAID